MSQLQLVIFSLILFLLIVLAAFFSMAETAIMAMNRYRLRHKARLKKRYALHLLKLIKRPDRILGAILIGSTFANILASSIATMIALHFGGERAALIAAFILSLIVLIFSEIVPKTIAALYPDQIARWVIYPVKIFLTTLYPLVWLANTITNGLLRFFRIKISYSHEPLSREELRSVVYETTGKMSRQYQNMLFGILDLNKLTVDDVMVPRHEIVGLDIEESWEEVLAHIKRYHQAWLPVYRETANQIIGVLYVSDVLRLILSKQIVNKEIIQLQLHEPYFVPAGTSLSMQLNNFQQSQNKIAFVVDEYGEIQGMLTLNDILEEIVGDFTSSLTAAKRIKQESDGSYLVDGALMVREFNRVTESELPLRGPRTINGLIVEYLESLPRENVSMLIAGYPVEILKVKDNRVQQAKISPRLPAYHEHHEHDHSHKN